MTAFESAVAVRRWFALPIRSRYGARLTLPYVSDLRPGTWLSSLPSSRPSAPIARINTPSHPRSRGGSPLKATPFCRSLRDDSWSRRMPCAATRDKAGIFGRRCGFIPAHLANRPLETAVIMIEDEGSTRARLLPFVSQTEKANGYPRRALASGLLLLVGGDCDGSARSVFATPRAELPGCRWTLIDDETAGCDVGVWFIKDARIPDRAHSRALARRADPDDHGHARKRQLLRQRAVHRRSRRTPVSRCGAEPPATSATGS